MSNLNLFLYNMAGSIYASSSIFLLLMQTEAQVVLLCMQSVQLELALKHKADGDADADAPLTLQHLNSMELAYMVGLHSR